MERLLSSSRSRRATSSFHLSATSSSQCSLLVLVIASVALVQSHVVDSFGFDVGSFAFDVVIDDEEEGSVATPDDAEEGVHVPATTRRTINR